VAPTLRTPLAAALLWACAPGAPAPFPLSSPTTLDALCVPDPSDGTRASCVVSLAEPGTVDIEITDGEETARFTSAEAASRHEVPIWGLSGGTEWVWAAIAGGAEVRGAFSTPALPEEVAGEVIVEGSGPSTLVQFLTPFDCRGGGQVAVLDRAGRVRWFADSGREDVDMAQLTTESTVALIADKAAVVEIDLLGRHLLDRDDYPLPVHHDIFRRDDLLYTFLADTWTESDGVDYVEDIVVALDRAGNVVWQWVEHDELDATLSSPIPGDAFWEWRFPGALDAWHSNALYPTEDGAVLVSIKHESSILRIAGDGAIEWVLAGDGVGGPLGTDFQLVDGGGTAAFGNEHHVALLPDGHLTVLDNDHKRGLELALDSAAGTATWAGDWPMSESCAIQGSVYPLDGAHRLVTCAPGHAIAEFDASAAMVGHYELTCPNGAVVPRTARGQPVDLWDGQLAGGVMATRLR
jgi:hypothetical protein